MLPSHRWYLNLVDCSVGRIWGLLLCIAARSNVVWWLWIVQRNQLLLQRDSIDAVTVVRRRQTLIRRSWKVAELESIEVRPCWVGRRPWTGGGWKIENNHSNWETGLWAFADVRRGDRRWEGGGEIVVLVNLKKYFEAPSIRLAPVFPARDDPHFLSQWILWLSVCLYEGRF